MKMMKTLLIAVFFFTIALSGCSKLTPENYSKLKVGMDYQEVVSIIGEPDKCDAVLGAKNCVWGSDAKNITIKFVADKVVISTMKGL